MWSMISQEVEFVEATGKIHFINTNKLIAKWLGLAMLCVVIIFLYHIAEVQEFYRQCLQRNCI